MPENQITSCACGQVLMPHAQLCEDRLCENCCKYEHICSNCDQSLHDHNCDECENCSGFVDPGDLCREDYCNACHEDQHTCANCGDGTCSSEHEDNCRYCDNCERYRDSDRFCEEDYCGTCCERNHYTCSNNTSHHGSDIYLCSNCTNCHDCCECFYCESCCERCSYICNNCDLGDYCRDCCNCSEHETYSNNSGSGRIQYFEGYLTFYQDNSLDSKDLTARYTAVEIEVSDLNSNHANVIKAVKNYNASIVTDGSIRDGNCKFEINTNPANGSEFLLQIDRITSALSIGNAQANSSCGLHCHVDARDLSWSDLTKFIYLYRHIEPALLGILPKERYDGSGDRSWCTPNAQRMWYYCHNNQKHAEYKKAMQDAKPCKINHIAVVSAIYDGYNEHLGYYILRSDKHYVNDAHKEYHYVKSTARKYHQSRYHAINLHSFTSRKTIECRLHPGTVDCNTIQSWGQLWSAIVQTAKLLPLKRLQAICSSTSDLLHQENVRQFRDKLPHYYVKYDNRTNTESFGVLQLIAPNNQVAEWLHAQKKKHWSTNFKY